MEKSAGDVIILYMCTKNHNYMMYGSWDTECDRQNFFFILGYLWPFYPQQPKKIKNFWKMKKNARDIIILHMCTTNCYHIMYGS